VKERYGLKHQTQIKTIEKYFLLEYESYQVYYYYFFFFEVRLEKKRAIHLCITYLRLTFVYKIAEKAKEYFS